MKLGNRKIFIGSIALIVVLLVYFFRNVLISFSQNIVYPPISTVQPIIPQDPIESSPTPKTPEFNDAVVLHDSQHIKNLTKHSIDQAQTSFLRSKVDSNISQIDVYTIWFSIPISETNTEDSIIKAQVFIPQSTKNLPLLIYGSGTTGIAANCAPSLENVSKKNIGNYFNQMTTLASLGYIVIFPDYEGFGSIERSHPYFVADLEARTLLGSIEAIEELPLIDNAKLPVDWQQIFLMGYSQGGHAALSGAVQHDWLSEGKKIQGVIGYAPAFNVQALMIESPRLAPYLLYAYFKHYRLNHTDLNNILLSKHVANLESDVYQHCIDSIYSFYPAEPEGIYHATFWHYLITQELDQHFPEFAQVLQVNQGHLWETSIPLYIIQGKKDTIVTPITQQKNVQQFCQNDMPVTYTVLEHANHFQTPSQGTLLAHQWIQKKLAGSEVQNNCTTILN